VFVRRDPKRESVKVVQRLMCHADSRIAMEVYAQGEEESMRAAREYLTGLFLMDRQAGSSSLFCDSLATEATIPTCSCCTLVQTQQYENAVCISLILKGLVGGPDRDRTDDLFHAMESQEGRFVDGKGLMSRLSR